MLNGFEKLFEESFNRFFDPLHRYAFSLLKNNARAGDAVQLVFIKWWEAKTSLENMDDVRRYLFTAVYRSCLNSIRNEKTKQAHVVTYVHEWENEYSRFLLAWDSNVYR